MPDLFTIPNTPSTPDSASRPLADRLRPSQLSEIVGQDHIIGGGALIDRIVQTGQIPSLLLWGPPGSGKTTLARLMAQHSHAHFEQISAIFSGVADLKKLFDVARFRVSQGQSTLLFVDEIHRFNKAQQDAFLPVIEDGTITLIGATTENPSFELNAALLSRCQVLVLKRLDDVALTTLVARAEQHFERPCPLDGDAIATLKALADGDGRYFLTLLEQIFLHTQSGDTLTNAALLKLATN